jgi:methionyl-tRNA formyltransferase
VTEGNNGLRIGWMSHHVEGIKPLLAVLSAGFPIQAIITLQDDRLAKRSGAADFSIIAEDHAIPLYRIRNVNDQGSVELLDALQLDVLFVIGWSQILRAAALGTVKAGCFGAHASLLPANRGSAPINWALIKGEKMTGNTLMLLSEGVDAGDIVAQKRIPITPFDNVDTLYDRVAETNCDMILDLLKDLGAGRPLTLRRQIESGAALLPRRRPEDGLIDWRQPAGKVYNFVRALARPYPGAFSHSDEGRMLIWRSALLPVAGQLAAPGTVIGAMVSDSPEGNGQVVACAEGALIVLEVEDASGRRWAGPDLVLRGLQSFTELPGVKP